LLVQKLAFQRNLVNWSCSDPMLVEVRKELLNSKHGSLLLQKDDAFERWLLQSWMQAAS
jgi:hypothetical protein